MLNQRIYPLNSPSIKAIETKSYDHVKTIAYECAWEIIGSMIGICCSLIYEEKKKQHPNQAKIQELWKRVSQLDRERFALEPTDEKKVKHISHTYGQKIKNYYTNGELPV